MGLLYSANMHIQWVCRFQNPSIPVPIVLTCLPFVLCFCNLDATKTVFMAKSELVKTGIYCVGVINSKSETLA